VSRTLVYAVIGLCALAGAVWLGKSLFGTPDPRLFETEVELIESSSSDTQSTPTSPFAVANESQDNISPGSEQLDNSDLASIREPKVTQLTEPPGNERFPVDVSALGHQPFTDAEFITLANRIRSDPELLQQLVDEFRQESEPGRRAALARLLGEVGGPAVTLTASELIYSGDDESRRIGLQLLQQIQPGNAEARDIASTLLATEVEPVLLVDTLTTLAKPGEVDDNSRQILADQVAFLAEHQDENVRSISLNILSRWDNDGRYTQIIQDGLSDEAERVRESAAYALVGQDDADQNLIASLLAVAVDRNEEKSVRGGAVLALKGMSLSEYERQQVLGAEQDLATIRR